MKKKPSVFEKFIEILEGEFLDEAESLKEVTDEQWKSMSFPIGLVNKIKATFKEAPKPVLVIQKEEQKKPDEEKKINDFSNEK